MAKNNIETGIHYRAIHTFPFYYRKIRFPITDIVGNDSKKIFIKNNYKLKIYSFEKEIS